MKDQIYTTEAALRAIDKRKFDEIFERLGNKSDAERKAAQSELFAMGDTGRELLLAKFQELPRLRRRRVGMLLCLLTAFILLISLKPSVVNVGFYWFMSPIAAFIAFRRRTNQATRALSQMDDIRAIGFLGQALNNRDVETNAAAKEALKRLLPRLQASDANLLNAAQRELLYRELDGCDIPLILAILKALEQIGDDEALLRVEYLASSNSAMMKIPLVESAVFECLPFLEQRVAMLAASSQLLRAARPEQTAPETLLRPVASNEESAPEQLLRAANR